MVKMERRSEVARKLLEALDLHEAGISLMRARLRRRHPDAEDTVVEQHLRAWLHARPGAPWGDTIGVIRRG